MPSQRTLKRRKQRQASVQRQIDRMGPHQEAMVYLAREMWGSLAESVLRNYEAQRAMTGVCDMAFKAGEQWPDDVRAARIGDTIHIQKPRRLPQN